MATLAHARRIPEGVESIREFIRSGDAYQVNFTYRMRGAACSEPWGLFRHLVDAQEPTCGAFVDTGEWVICSASPELFFRLDGGQIESRPMKGTAPRGLWPADDRRKARRLRASPKDRAEIVMIVELVRNDLGRIAEVGSVSVPAVFAVQRYPTLWQMVSTVCARTQVPLPRIFQALFPPASITGAAKRRTMEIIAELESSPRRIYTGAVGFAAPGRRAQFNVAIRTVLVDTRRHEAEYGVGGGIVWDSRCASERQECRVKTRVLRFTTPPFDLLETMLWEPERGYSLLGRHLSRLAQSAAYFGFSADGRRIRQELDRVASRLPMVPHRVRLLVSRAGAARVDASPFAAYGSACARIVPAQGAVDASDRFLYHKTTHRGVYEDALKTRPGFSDVILFNRKGEVTESTIANVVVDIEGRLCTPPVRCGLLPGTYPAFLLGRKAVRERVVRLEELLRSPSGYLVTSLRGMWRVTVLHPEAQAVAEQQGRGVAAAAGAARCAIGDTAMPPFPGTSS